VGENGAPATKWTSADADAWLQRIKDAPDHSDRMTYTPEEYREFFANTLDNYQRFINEVSTLLEKVEGKRPRIGIYSSPAPLTHNVSCHIQQDTPNASQIRYTSTTPPMAPAHRGVAQLRIKPAGLLSGSKSELPPISLLAKKACAGEG
jgi:hypothetical protein